MNSFRRAIALFCATLVGAAVIAGPAAAHPGGALKKAPLRAINATALIDAAAVELGITPDTLTTAIRDSANTRLDTFASKPGIPDALVTRIRTRIADNLRVAIRWSRASTVASNLGITVKELNDGFRAARKTLATKRIDEALAAGKITQAQADRLKARLAKAKLPGYRAFFAYGFWLGGFHHFPHPTTV